MTKSRYLSIALACLAISPLLGSGHHAVILLIVSLGMAFFFSKGHQNPVSPGRYARNLYYEADSGALIVIAMSLYYLFWAAGFGNEGKEIGLNSLLGIGVILGIMIGGILRFQNTKRSVEEFIFTLVVYGIALGVLFFQTIGNLGIERKYQIGFCSLFLVFACMCFFFPRHWNPIKKVFSLFSSIPAVFSGLPFLMQLKKISLIRLVYIAAIIYGIHNGSSWRSEIISSLTFVLLATRYNIFPFHGYAGPFRSMFVKYLSFMGRAKIFLFPLENLLYVWVAWKLQVHWSEGVLWFIAVAGMIYLLMQMSHYRLMDLVGSYSPLYGLATMLLVAFLTGYAQGQEVGISSIMMWVVFTEFLIFTIYRIDAFGAGSAWHLDNFFQHAQEKVNWYMFVAASFFLGLYLIDLVATFTLVGSGSNMQLQLFAALGIAVQVLLVGTWLKPRKVIFDQRVIPYIQ